MWRRNHFEHEVLRRLARIEQLLETPKAYAVQLGDSMIGNITAGQTGQFGGVIQFPAGVTPPAGYNPTLTWSSSDPGITFAPATTDLSTPPGLIPLANQVVATVPTGDTDTSAEVGFSFLGVDGETVIDSNPVPFMITPAPPPPTEPTGLASQLA
jgi:hypothetical protein